MFGRNFEHLLNFFLVTLGVSGGASIQLPFLKSFIAQIGAKLFHLTKNAPHLKKIDIGEAKK
jgi:hypothetical protein